MPLLYQRMALLAKIETAYGTDAAPTGAANAIQAFNVRITPQVVTREAREVAKTYLGANDDVTAAFYAQIDFEVEWCGAGTPGAQPAWGPLHQGCGMAATVAAGVSVTYTPVSANFEALTMWGHIDGVLHKMVGCRGELGGRAQYRGAPRWIYSMKGIFVPVIDEALPTAVLTGFLNPVALNKQNTPLFNLHGVTTQVLRNYSFQLGNTVVYRNMVNSEAVRITGRSSSFSLEMGAELMALRNWHNVIQAGTRDWMNLVHGTVAGNIVEVATPGTRIDDFQYGEFEGDVMAQISGKLLPLAPGNNEVSIVVR